jgi:hypothetical protein
MIKFFSAVAAGVFALAANVLPLHADESVVYDRISGLWILQEWHKDGEVFKPPQVEGRFVLLNGAVMTVLQNGMVPEKKTTLITTGKYSLDETSYSYGYDKWTIYTETPNEISVSHKPLWEEVRRFRISTEYGVIRITQENNEHQLVFKDDELTYLEKGKVLRVWRKAKEGQ